MTMKAMDYRALAVSLLNALRMTYLLSLPRTQQAIEQAIEKLVMDAFMSGEYGEQSS